jgi:hypothetical protein
MQRPLHDLDSRPRWLNGYVERLVGTLRRELADHLIVLGPRHLSRCFRDYVRYYNVDRFAATPRPLE